MLDRLLEIAVTIIGVIIAERLAIHWWFKDKTNSTLAMLRGDSKEKIDE